MSKSAPDASSRILFTDSSSQIASKIRSAVTDSISGITYDPVNRPGTANLLSILAACNDEDVNKTVSRYAGKNHGALKADVTEAVEEMLKGPRKEYEKLKMDKEYLRRVAQEGAERARVKSEATMMEVRERIGLL
jgi:tryptophanyl-tRNA synthetase